MGDATLNQILQDTEVDDTWKATQQPQTQWHIRGHLKRDRLESRGIPRKIKT
jgi:hypothetical protein